MKLIRVAVMAVCLSLAAVVPAANNHPVPRHLPDPEIPAGLGPGEVTLRVIIRPNGSVEVLEVVRTTHPALAVAVTESVSLWHFEPWTPPESSPDGEKISITYTYQKGGRDSFPLALNVQLKKVRCSELTNEIEANKRSYSPAAQQEVSVLKNTYDYLWDGSVIRAFIPEAELLVLIDEFYAAVPVIINQCRKKPWVLYVDFLPEKVRRLF